MKKEGVIYTVAVQKGGAGKTTLANILNYDFACNNEKVVLVDLDPQATQTGSFFGFRMKGGFGGENESNITNIFSGKTVSPIINETVKYVDNPDKNKMHQPSFLKINMKLDFIPSNDELLDVLEADDYVKQAKIEKASSFLNNLKKDGTFNESELNDVLETFKETNFDREEKMKMLIEYLKELKSIYDVVIVDCPPSMGAITSAVLRITDSLLIPAPTKNVDTEGLVGFFEKLDSLYNKYEFNIKKFVIVPNMYDKRLKDAKSSLELEIGNIPRMLQCTKNLRKIECLITEPLPQNSAIQEAPSYNMFLVPFIMEYCRSKNASILLTIKNIIKTLKV